MDAFRQKSTRQGRRFARGSGKPRGAEVSTPGTETQAGAEDRQPGAGTATAQRKAVRPALSPTGHQ